MSAVVPSTHKPWIVVPTRLRLSSTNPMGSMAMSGRVASSLAIIRPTAPAPISKVGTLRSSDPASRCHSARSVHRRAAILRPRVKEKPKERSMRSTESGIWPVLKSLLPDDLLRTIIMHRVAVAVLKAARRFLASRTPTYCQLRPGARKTIKHSNFTTKTKGNENTKTCESATVSKPSNRIKNARQ